MSYNNNTKLIIIIISVLWCCFFAVATSIMSFGDSFCIETERQALLKFKHDLSYDPSNILSSWVGNECCRWDGIVCSNSTRHVTQIKLPNPYPSYIYDDDYDHYNQQILGGKINPSLVDLKHLRHLDLSNNFFNYSTIPSFIGSIISLRYLNLSWSGFSGNIPHQLGNLSSLRRLDFGNNDYGLSSDSLRWVSGLVSLRYLDLSGVDLSKTIGNWEHVTSMLPSLLELHLHQCQLRDISQSITGVNFTSLSILDLSFNSFNSHAPEWLFNLPRLVSLDIGGRSFSDSPFPSALQNTTSIKSFFNSNNDGSSVRRIPKWFYSLKYLEVIHLYDNMLESVLANEIENLTSMTSLDLRSNNLEGSVPVSLGKLRNLKVIMLSHNNLYTLEIGNFLKSFMFKRLEVLDLRRANVTGHLPDEIGDFTNLAFISLSDNSISGRIPSSMGKLSNLRYLDLSYNLLNGTLPIALGQLTLLQTLAFDGNSMEGVIRLITDLHFANLKSLKWFTASGNKLTWKSHDFWIPPFQLEYLDLRNWYLGSRFPSWLQSQKKLFYLDISNTRISDVIPTKFWDKAHASFQYLNLSSNGIYGEIPSDGVRFVAFSGSISDLSSNNFTGPLPPSMSKVYWLDLSNNSFSGSLHQFFCYQTNSNHFINFRNNNLSGNIPDCFKNWKNLAILNLDNNYLNGSIPNSIRDMYNLKYLHLRNNNLSGKLPQTLKTCTQLQTIDLGGNQFSGNIPTWVGKSFSLLVNLNLHYNRFYGQIPNELCHLQSLQILDLAHNSLSGLVPMCFNNFSALINTEQNMNYGTESYPFVTAIYNSHTAISSDNAVLVTKGTENEYISIIALVKFMDLSSNNLSGWIPEGLTRLAGLRFLNLSRNHFSGSIPVSIGEMSTLESLDLSFNLLSGDIPLSISRLNSLNILNLSNNELTGQIPSSTQLQSLDESSFADNKLCGPPLGKCNGNRIVPKVVTGVEEEGDKYRDLWFIGSIAIGFIVGFWFVIGPLVLSKSWRITYFGALDSAWCKLSDFISRCCYIFLNKRERV